MAETNFTFRDSTEAHRKRLAVQDESGVLIPAVTLYDGTGQPIHPDPAGWTYVTATAGDTGDNLIVAAPGEGQKIVVGLILCQVEVNTATVAYWKDGSDACFRARMTQDGDGLCLLFYPGGEWVLSENSALNLSLSEANSTGYTVRYKVEAA